MKHITTQEHKKLSVAILYFDKQIQYVFIYLLLFIYLLGTFTANYNQTRATDAAHMKHAVKSYPVHVKLI